MTFLTPEEEELGMKWTKVTDLIIHNKEEEEYK
jgi:hypothetical protein